MVNIKRVNRCLLVMLSAALLYGCATTRSVLYEKTALPPKPSDFKIEIFSREGLNRPYKVIGIVIASTGLLHAFQDAVEHLQADAKKMGGDALIDLTQGLPEGEAMPSGGWFIFGERGEIWSARVITWE